MAKIGTYTKVYCDPKGYKYYPVIKGLVVAVDRQTKTVKVQDTETGQVYNVLSSQLRATYTQKDEQGVSKFLHDMGEMLIHFRQRGYEDVHTPVTRSWLVEQLKMLNSNEQVEEAYLASTLTRTHLIIRTKNIPVDDCPEDSWDTAPITGDYGRMLIKLSPKETCDLENLITMKNIDYQAHRPGYGTVDHPHVFSYGRVCFGNSASATFAALKRADLYSLVEICLNMLSTTISDDEDEYGYFQGNKRKVLVPRLSRFVGKKEKLKWN